MKSTKLALWTSLLLTSTPSLSAYAADEPAPGTCRGRYSLNQIDHQTGETAWVSVTQPVNTTQNSGPQVMVNEKFPEGQLWIGYEPQAGSAFNHVYISFQDASGQIFNTDGKRSEASFRIFKAGFKAEVLCN